MQTASGKSWVIRPCWTGGQYSLYRILFAAYLIALFATISAGRPNLVSIMSAMIGIVAGVSLLVGLFGRVAAVVIAVSVWFIVPLHPVWPGVYVAVMLTSLLAFHMCQSPQPYGSWAARGLLDPRGGWRMSPFIYAVAWVWMAVGYTSWGMLLLDPAWQRGEMISSWMPVASSACAALVDYLPNDVLDRVRWGTLILAISVAPLALVRRLRPWLWMVMLIVNLLIVAIAANVNLIATMMMLHLLTFDPGWLQARKKAATETIFYDGHCGLCHCWVRFVLAEDYSGNAFRFAPLQSAMFSCLIPNEQREKLPDSIVVRTSGGQFLSRSTAVIHVLARLGGVWRMIGFVIWLLPLSIRNFAYDGVVVVRYKLQSPPDKTCPMLPADLRRRFDL